MNPLAAPSVTPSKSRRIFVVEDSSDFSFLLKCLLEKEGYHVQCAANGAEALKILKDLPLLPHLILLDIMMPVMDGPEFRRHQESDLRLARVPVVIMTAHRDVQITQVQIGAKGYIQKPPDIDRILEVVKRHSDSDD